MSLGPTRRSRGTRPEAGEPLNFTLCEEKNMKSKEKHTCFRSPDDPSIKIWRYMDFTKYVACLEKRSLYFSRSDKLDDPYEGATSHANIKLRPAVYKDSIPEKVLEQMSAFAKWNRQWTYINCWHMNEHESAAMWKLYAQTQQAVVLQSTFERLAGCLPDEIYVGMVNYIDYETEWLPEGNAFWPYVHKRKSFEHERELRAVILEVPTPGDQILIGPPNSKLGRQVAISLTDLIEAVHVSPEAPEWFAELVVNVAAKYGFKFEIKHSVLSKTPVY